MISGRKPSYIMHMEPSILIQSKKEESSTH